MELFELIKKSVYASVHNDYQNLIYYHFIISTLVYSKRYVNQEGEMTEDKHYFHSPILHMLACSHYVQHTTFTYEREAICKFPIRSNPHHRKYSNSNIYAALQHVILKQRGVHSVNAHLIHTNTFYAICHEVVNVT